MDNDTLGFVGICAAAVLVLLFGIVGYMFAIPHYKVYKQDLEGQANLAQQEWEKKIYIEEARAKLEAAKMFADAEVARAKGVAEANKIIGDSLKDNESYLRYLWILGLQDGSSEVIYIPTESNMPILEAGRFSKQGK